MTHYTSRKSSIWCSNPENKKPGDSFPRDVTKCNPNLPTVTTVLCHPPVLLIFTTLVLRPHQTRSSGEKWSRRIVASVILTQYWNIYKIFFKTMPTIPIIKTRIISVICQGKSSASLNTISLYKPHIPIFISQF